jgi:hypothetical protein
MLRTDTYDLLKSSYLPQSEAAKRMQLKGYNYDKDLSSMNTKVYVKDNKPIIVHRGSVTAKDWFDDGLIALGLGKYGHRYKNAQRVTQKAKEKYDSLVDSVSHSYGGWLTENSGADGNLITYNKAVGLGDIGKRFPSNQLDIRTEGDIPSLLSYLQNSNKEIIHNKHLNKNSLNSHNLDNLIE